MNKNERLKRKNKKWLEKYGVSYTDCLSTELKENGKKTSYTKKILLLFKDYKWKYITLIFLGILFSVIGILGPICWQNIIDNLTLGQFDIVIYFVFGLTLFLIIEAMVKYFLNNSVNITYQKMSLKLRNTIVNNVLATKISKFDTTSSGEILNRIDSSSCDFSSDFVNILNIATNLLRNSIFIVYGFFINIYLGLIVFFIGIYRFLLEKYYNEKYKKIIEKRDMEIFDKNTNLYTEIIHGVRDIKSLNNCSSMSEKATKLSTFQYNNSVNMSVSYQKFLIFRTISYALLYGGFLIIAIFLIQNLLVTIGGLLVLIMYRGNTEELFDDLGDLMGSKQSIEVNAERIYEVLADKDYPKEQFGTKNLKKVKGEIEFKDVDFGYKEDKLLFEKLNLKILPNECVGFVGKSGQGKSTIINLIPKLYEVNSGKILLDGVDINKLTEESLRDNICVVSQTPYIFNYSIKENMQFAKADASNEEIEEACKKAYLSEFIESLPEKYETKIGEGGVQLSGGQRQRLAIARALLKNSKIILFDEATSALDNESQEKIQQAIDDMKKEKTIIIVAHRLTTVKDCDKIFVLDNHKIVGEGSHKELMRNCNEYKNLYHNRVE